MSIPTVIAGLLAGRIALLCFFIGWSPLAPLSALRTTYAVPRGQPSHSIYRRRFCYCAFDPGPSAVAALSVERDSAKACRLDRYGRESYQSHRRWPRADLSECFGGRASSRMQGG